MTPTIQEQEKTPRPTHAGVRAPTAVQVAGQALTVFEESPPLVAAMVEDIRRATTRVWLESYTIVADAAGRAVAEALKGRARAGLDVRLMYDAFGSLGTPADFFQDLHDAGVGVHAYHTVREAFRRSALCRVLNRRNHRKLLVVDDRVAYFGGMNLVDQRGIRTVADAQAHQLPASAGWRDVHVRLEGPRQRNVADAMDRLWRREHRQRGVRWPAWPLRRMLAGRGERIEFFESRPSFKARRTARIFVPLIRRARRSITVSMAYFVPVGRVLRELIRASRRGVRVRVILPGQSDVRLAQWAGYHLYARLLRAGIHIFERRDNMLHSKVMVIDDRWTVTGSCNLDARSLRLNLEFVAVIASPALAAVMNDICAYEVRHSRRVRRRHVAGRRWWQRLRDRMAWALRWWL
jgi:cardiolipin synthase